MDYPKNKREARKWIREHWANMICQADMLFLAELCSPLVDVWEDECQKIAKRLES